MVIAVGGGWLALSLTGGLAWVFAALGMALMVYGVLLSTAIAAGVWFRSWRNVGSDPPTVQLAARLHQPRSRG